MKLSTGVLILVEMSLQSPAILQLRLIKILGWEATDVMKQVYFVVIWQIWLNLLDMYANLICCLSYASSLFIRGTCLEVLLVKCDININFA